MPLPEMKIKQDEAPAPAKLSEPLPDLDFVTDKSTIPPAAKAPLALSAIDEFEAEFTESSVMAIDIDQDVPPLQADVEQVVAFSTQLALAAELSMPVFLHCRDAHDRFLTLLKPWLEKIPGAVLHCFTGSRSEVQECLDLGLFIGITGWVCDERRGLELRELLPAIPAERLLLETDAPYLLPRDLKPKPASRRNEPAYLPHILASVAIWRGEEAQWLEAQTDANVRALFGVDVNGV